MKNSTKIWLGIAGILLIVLGVTCLVRPVETLLTVAWLIGIGTLITGISKLIFTFRTQAFLPNSGSRMISAILLIILGIILLGNKLFVTAYLPVIFAVWVIIEGVTIAIQSFDYKQVGFGLWWIILLLGIGAICLGFMGLRNPIAAANMLSDMIGIGVIALGLSYLTALCGINRFEKTFGPDQQ